MEVYADGKGDYYGALRSAGTQNIRIAGRGLFDFSAVQGGDSKAVSYTHLVNQTWLESVDASTMAFTEDKVRCV